MTLELTPIALDDLATAASLETYGYPAGASAYLARASARVRGFAGMTITPGTATCRFCAHTILLPERPVRSVTTLTVIDGGTVLVADTDYWLSGSLLHVADAYMDTRLEAVYEHGFAVLPAELVELVCAVATRMYKTDPSVASGVTSEGSGGESIAFGSEAYNGLADLTKAEKRTLKRILGLNPAKAVEVL